MVLQAVQVELHGHRPVPGPEALRGPVQQRHGAAGVSPLQVGETDGQLGQPPPQLPLLVRRGLPRGLEHLVGLEREPGVEQALRLAHRLGRRALRVVGDGFDTRGASGERPAGGIARAGVAGASGAVPVPSGAGGIRHATTVARPVVTSP